MMDTCATFARLRSARAAELRRPDPLAGMTGGDAIRSVLKREAERTARAADYARASRPFGSNPAIDAIRERLKLTFGAADALACMSVPRPSLRDAFAQIEALDKAIDAAIDTQTAEHFT